MDQRRLDELAKLASTEVSRRSTLKLLLGGAVGAMFSGFGAGKASAAPPDGRGSPGPPSHSGAPPHAGPPVGQNDCCPSDHPRLCGLTCVDPQTDPAHCGSCGNQCASHQICEEGICVDVGECVPGETRACGLGDVGVCQFGTETCQSDGTWGLCEGAVGPQPETCNGLDDDCDGLVDNVDPAILLDDPDNCGACFNACDGSEDCVDGQCVPGSACQEDADCDLGDACTHGICVDGVCQHTPIDCNDGNECTVDTCDPELGCQQSPAPDGTICSAGVCSNGQCVTVCGPGQANCGGTCVDLATDPDHCGACGFICSEDEICQSGLCVEETCPPGTSACGELCVDLQTDPEHCGTCGINCDDGNPCTTHACEDGQCMSFVLDDGTTCSSGGSAGICEDGTCVVVGECLAGETRPCGVSDMGVCQYGTQICRADGTWGPCEGAVGPQPETCNLLDDDCDGQIDNVDPAVLQDDPENCGACFNVCEPGQTCESGVCV